MVRFLFNTYMCTMPHLRCNNNFFLSSKSESNLFDLDSNSGFGNFQNVKSESENSSCKMSKDSIMALFNQPPQQQQQQPQPQQQLPAFMTDFNSVPKLNPFGSKFN